MMTLKHRERNLIRSRETICDDIVKKSVGSEAYYLAGLPCVGKSFVLEEVKLRLKEMPGRQVCTIDLKDFIHRKDPEYEIWHFVFNWIDRKLSLWRKILMLLRRHRELSIEKTGNSALDELYAWMDRFYALKNARFNKMSLIFLNFDRCVEFKNSKSFINDVTFLLGKCKEYDVGIVFESRQSFDMIERRTSCSFPTGKKACLQPVNEEDIEEYLRAGGHETFCFRREEVLRYSCGIPYLIDEYCSTPAPEKSVRMARSSYFEKLSDFLKSIKEDGEFEREGAENWFNVLAQREAYPRVVRPSPLFRESMDFYGMGALSLPKSFCMFGEYLRDCLRSRDMQKEIDDLERNFRSLISRKLESYYGQKEWFSALKIPENEDWGLRTKRKQPFVDQIKNKLKGDSLHLLPIQKMDFQDLCGLISLTQHWDDDGSREWKGFMRWFGNDRKKCQWAFSAIILSRNRVYHANDPEDDRIADYCRAVEYFKKVVLPNAEKEVNHLLGE